MPREVLDAIYARSTALMQRQADAVPRRRSSRRSPTRASSCCAGRRRPTPSATQLSNFFRTKVFPVLTPLAVDPAHPFPYISGLSLNLAVVVRNPSTGTELFARVKVPPILERFVLVGPQRFVPLEDIIAAHLGELFPGMEVLQHHAFRVTRNEDLEVEEDDAENLLLALERELMRRRFGPPVRLEVEQSIDPHVLDLLVRELGIGSEEVVRIPGLLDLTALWAVDRLPRDDLKLRGVPARARAAS